MKWSADDDDPDVVHRIEDPFAALVIRGRQRMLAMVFVGVEPFASERFERDDDARAWCELVIGRLASLRSDAEKVAESIGTALRMIRN